MENGHPITAYVGERQSFKEGESSVISFIKALIGLSKKGNAKATKKIEDIANHLGGRF